MKILEEGRNWNNWVLQVECKNTNYSGCGALLEVNIADITHTKGSRYNYGWEYGWECYENADFYSFICPPFVFTQGYILSNYIITHNF